MSLVPVLPCFDVLEVLMYRVFLGASASGAPYDLIRVLLVLVLVLRGHFLKLAL